MLPDQRRQSGVVARCKPALPVRLWPQILGETDTLIVIEVEPAGPQHGRSNFTGERPWRCAISALHSQKAVPWQINPPRVGSGAGCASCMRLGNVRPATKRIFRDLKKFRPLFSAWSLFPKKQTTLRIASLNELPRL